MKTFFVVNPYSANKTTGKRWGQLAAIIGRTLSDFGVEFTKASMDAVGITRRALESGYECIVAVGGDGTINEVVNGFFANEKVINPKAALGVLPRGTGGDFRRTFEWSTDFESAVKRLKTPDTRPFDIGLLEYVAHDGTTQKRYFANVASFGVSGLVDQQVNTTSKALGGRVSFMLASAKALAMYSDKTVTLSIDGVEQPPMPITTVAIGNGQYFGGGMKIAPTADVSDGIFDVTVWSGYGFGDFIFKASSLYSGSHVNLKGTRTHRCKTLSARSDSEVLIDCDGEQPGRLPCKMTILPSAIRLKV